jgi:hypothetical protein
MQRVMTSQLLEASQQPNHFADKEKTQEDAEVQDTGNSAGDISM